MKLFDSGTKDRISIYVSLVSFVISLGAFYVSIQLYKLSHNSEITRLERYLGDVYLQSAISLQVQKCYQSVLGENLTEDQIKKERIVNGKFMELDQVIKILSTLSDEKLKQVESETISEVYGMSLDHYNAILDMRLQMTTNQIDAAQQRCLGEVSI